MIDVVQQHRDELATLCRQYDVERMDLFGSAAAARFDALTSDLDFLVIFRRDSAQDPANRYFGLLADMEGLLGRHVDLVDLRACRNPYFVAEALKHREMLYAA